MDARIMSSIIEFPVRVPDEDIFRHEETRRLYGAWLGEARRGRHPALRAFAPGRLGRWLSWCGVAELVEEAGEPFADHRPRWRLAGSSICKLAGRELEGEELFAGWQRFERSMLKRMILRTLREGHPFVARLELGTTPGGREFGLEMLALPFVEGKRTVALMFFRPSLDTVTLVPEPLDKARMVSLRALDLPATTEPLRTRPLDPAPVVTLFGAGGRP